MGGYRNCAIGRRQHELACGFESGRFVICLPLRLRVAQRQRSSQEQAWLNRSLAALPSPNLDSATFFTLRCWRSRIFAGPREPLSTIECSAHRILIEIATACRQNTSNTSRARLIQSSRLSDWSQPFASLEAKICDDGSQRDGISDKALARAQLLQEPGIDHRRQGLARKAWIEGFFFDMSRLIIFVTPYSRTPRGTSDREVLQS